MTSSQIDVLLLPFLESVEEEEEVLLYRLVAEQVEPTIRRVLERKLQFYVNRGGLHPNPDAEEVYGEVQLHLLRRLRELKKDPAGKPISNLRGYAAMVARHTCDEYLRHKYPWRRHLKDQIRYHLISRREFALWEDPEKGWLSGLAAWELKKTSSHEDAPEPAVGSLPEVTGGNMRRDMKLHELLMLLFQSTGRPLELDQLTGAVARLWGVADQPVLSLDEGDPILSKRLVSSDPGPDSLAEQHQLIQQLWLEICRLPRRQRVALLFNLKSPKGVNVITLFPLTGVATFQQLANALELPLAEFERVSADLPMDDSRIAEYLGATRQQVINLRRTARERLARRVKALKG
jgi:RNA polymerase sigma factor (sigma-70 family)